MKSKMFTLFFLILYQVVCGQKILPTPMEVELFKTSFIFSKEIVLAYEKDCIETAQYLSDRLDKYFLIKLVESDTGDIVLAKSITYNHLGEEGYWLRVSQSQINISSISEKGLFYGVQTLLQLLPVEVQAGAPFTLNNYKIQCLEVMDQPKYDWRSFMLDSGRQYQKPQFIKKYLEHLAMLKMNVFHWHLTEGQGWRIEIKKYPRLAKIGSKVAKGKEQQGYYTQEEIKDIVAFASKLHITIVPEIDVPGHSEAALTAYPEMSCFNEVPANIMSFSSTLFCGGKEDTYQFLQDILDEVCELFPSEYIHLGGDEAPKDNWDKCPDCQLRIKQEKLNNTHDLQLYFSSRLANYLKTKGRKVIFWGDILHRKGMELPDNVVIQWWNWNSYKDKALKQAVKRGHQVICNTNYGTYLNYPIKPWFRYKKKGSYDLKTTYEQNPSDLSDPHDLVLGMGCCMWTDWSVKENLIDRRVFPRIFSLSEQMWSKGERLKFDEFHKKVKAKYPLLRELGIDFGPALKDEVPLDYRWN
ncbi:beta-hexosaminidase [Ancylomarina euxinus]|uniref:beta-N-acetylhexosaminidase n=1 Tax=Ancylomarina euxinus TaxID=2283627 RepID=A0A425Y1L9_9BACT|nr:beta-N-acetylhexosaminidase [Ancylomarina euxinus]MCZ4695108.1 beta-N-acetylhexosaminidase [Ancylomarina euxinus]MUP14956.1 family 20 glycosylhydrolase [Ancylomarina euxinus]RRG21848.1 beta-hexosaminidase [Ancylomarina euxinus]